MDSYRIENRSQKEKNTLNCDLTAIFTMIKALKNGPLLLYNAIK